MKLFIDCEFNSFEGDLITMALVDETGRHWYKAVPLYQPIHPWVADNVIPVLGEVECLGFDLFAVSLEAFLSAYDVVHVIADWPEDIKYFTQALVTGPGTRIDTPPLTMEVRRDLDVVSAVPHNALEDARAIRRHYLELHT